MNFAVAMGSPLAPLAPTVSGSSAVPSAGNFTLAVDAALVLNAGATAGITPVPAVSPGPKPMALLVDKAFQTLYAAIDTGAPGVATAASDTIPRPTPPTGTVPRVPATAAAAIPATLPGVAMPQPAGGAVVGVLPPVAAPAVTPADLPLAAPSPGSTSAKDRDAPRTDDAAPAPVPTVIGADPVVLPAQPVVVPTALAQTPIVQDPRPATPQPMITIPGGVVQPAEPAVVPKTADRSTVTKPQQGKSSPASLVAAQAVPLAGAAATPMPSIVAVDANGAGSALATKEPAAPVEPRASEQPASALASEPPVAPTGTLLGVWASEAVVADSLPDRTPMPSESTDGGVTKRVGDGAKLRDLATAVAMPSAGREQPPVTSAIEGFSVPETAGAVSGPGVKPAAIGAVAEPVVAARPGHIGREVGVEIARRVSSGGDELVVRLVPAELGRIEVRMSFDERGGLRAVIAADSPAALEMLRRDSADLSRSLTDAGVRSDAQSLSFQTDGNGSGGNRQQRSAWLEADGKSYRSAGTGPFADDAESLSYRQVRTSGRYDLLA